MNEQLCFKLMREHKTSLEVAPVGVPTGCSRGVEGLKVRVNGRKRVRKQRELAGTDTSGH